MLFLEFKLLNSDEVIVVPLGLAMNNMAIGENKLYLPSGMVEVEATKEQIKSTLQSAMNQMNQMQAAARNTPAIDLSKLHV